MDLVSRGAALHLTPTSEAANTAVDVLFHATGECSLGDVLVARSAKGVCAILLGDNPGEPGELKADLAGRFPKAALVAARHGFGGNRASHKLCSTR